MLEIDVLRNKPIKTYNNVERMDMTVSSINPNSVVEYSKGVIASFEFTMRPDLLALYYTNDMSSMGTLLKVNSISNPFSLEEGDILFLPSPSTIKNLVAPATSNQPEQKRVDFRKKLQDRVSSVSSDRKNYLESRAIANTANVPLPPNVASPEDQQFVVKGGKLILGSSIGNCRTNVSQNKSKATIKARITQQKIFG